MSENDSYSCCSPPLVIAEEEQVEEGKDSQDTHMSQEENNDSSQVDDYSSGAAHYHSGPKVSPPITLLQEICSRNGFTAEYQLLSTEGSVHEPTFKIAVTVDDITVTASGQSKKKARHAAAREAIEKLRQRSNLNFDGINFDTMTPMGEIQSKSVYALAANEANPVGKLQEICMKMRVNPPDYDTVTERGLAHERIFILSCTIASLNMTTLGEGRSKKLAKRQAAENMLAQLENSEIYDKASNTKTQGEVGASSLNMDMDDNSHFVRARRLCTELCGELDCTIEDLWDEVNMIEVDDVREDLFYESIQKTVSKFGSCGFNYLTDEHCLLNVYDNDKNIVLTAFGSGKSNSVAMRSCVLNAYKLMMCLLKPLTRTEDHHPTDLGHRAADQGDAAGCRPEGCQVALET